MRSTVTSAEDGSVTIGLPAEELEERNPLQIMGKLKASAMRYVQHVRTCVCYLSQCVVLRLIGLIDEHSENVKTCRALSFHFIQHTCALCFLIMFIYHRFNDFSVFSSWGGACLPLFHRVPLGDSLTVMRNTGYS